MLQGNTPPPDMWDKIYAWVNRAGRMIVIVVEVIVIASFIVRVVVDTQTKDLLEKESQLAGILTAQKTQEHNYIQRQQKFFTYRSIWDSSASFAAVMAELEKYRPRSVEDLSITFKGNTITYRGLATNSQIESFESALKKNNTLFSEVQVLEVENIDPNATSGNKSNFGIRIVVRAEALLQRPKISASTSGN